MEGNSRQLEDLIDNKTVVEISFKTSQQGVFFDTNILTQRKSDSGATLQSADPTRSTPLSGAATRASRCRMESNCAPT